VKRVAGVPVSLLGAAATVATATAGWLIDRHFFPPSGGMTGLECGDVCRHHDQRR
jgi:hypothetical protein